jgi:ribulose-phosphate 3-epimerase
MAHLLAPSLLASDFGNLQRDIEMVNASAADWLHVDVMDGVFVPNISFGFPVISHIKKHGKKPLDVHLMIVDPDRYLEEFKNVGANILTVHYEACNHLHRTATKIRELDMKAGVSINPHTPVSVLEEILPYIDMVLIMTVNPGYGGQSFIESSYNKIKKLKSMINSINQDVLIEVDGGVDLSNHKKLVQAGADVLVAGSSVFKAESPAQTIYKLKTIE